jgi:hypothetical protein
MCRKVAAKYVPEEKFAYEKYTCRKLCARSMQQECTARLQQTVCQRKNLHTKSILAAHLQVCEKYAAGGCRKVAANCVPEKKFA